MEPERPSEPDEFSKAWRTQASQTRVTFDADRVLREVQRSDQQFRSMVFWRDAREVVVALLMIPVWFILGRTLSLPWSWYLTAPVLVWIAGFMLVDRRLRSQQECGADEPLLNHVKKSLMQVEHQIWLLRNIFWWYLLPPSLSIMAFFVQVSWQTTGVWWGCAMLATLGAGFLFVLYGGVYRLNQLAVREQLEPRREQLSRLIDGLEGESSGGRPDDIGDLASALAGAGNCCGEGRGQGRSWSDGWSQLIPSWLVAAAILLTTGIGSLCGALVPSPDMPESFGAVVGAVIAFEIALGTAWLRARKRRVWSESAEVSREPPGAATAEDAVSAKGRILPHAPALVILALLLILSVMAVLLLSHLAREGRTGNGRNGRADAMAGGDGSVCVGRANS